MRGPSAIVLLFEEQQVSSVVESRREPHGLLVEPPVWYILARDVEKAEPRMFRMDRIARPRLLSEMSFRPDVRVLEAQLVDHERWRPLTGSWTA